MEWYLTALKKYAVFEGRARRKEYWYFVLFNLLISLGLGVIDGLIGLSGGLSGLYSLAVLVPSLAVAVRRLHDTGRSGWWLLIGFIPVIGLIVLIVFLASGSQTGQNKHNINCN